MQKEKNIKQIKSILGKDKTSVKNMPRELK